MKINVHELKTEYQTTEIYKQLVLGFSPFSTPQAVKEI